MDIVASPDLAGNELLYLISATEAANRAVELNQVNAGQSADDFDFVPPRGVMVVGADD